MNLRDRLDLASIARVFIKEAYRYDAEVNGRTWTPVRRAREIGTIHISSHRQAGHSTAIHALSTPASLLVVPPSAKTAKLTAGTRIAGHVHAANVRLTGHDMILVDGASSLSKNQISQLYTEALLTACFPHNALPLLVLFQ